MDSLFLCDRKLAFLLKTSMKVEKMERSLHRGYEDIRDAKKGWRRLHSSYEDLRDVKMG